MPRRQRFSLANSALKHTVAAEEADRSRSPWQFRSLRGDSRELGHNTRRTS